MKKILALVVVTLIMTVSLAVPVFAATNNSINPPSSYSTYAEYKDYVQGLLDEGLITQKGADALLEEYSRYNNGTSNGGYFGGCWGANQGGGYGNGYGGCYGNGYGGCYGGGYRR